MQDAINSMSLARLFSMIKQEKNGRGTNDAYLVCSSGAKIFQTPLHCDFFPGSFCLCEVMCL